MSDTLSCLTEAHFPGLTSVCQHPRKQEETSTNCQSRCHEARHQNVVPNPRSAEKAFAETMAPFGGPGATFGRVRRVLGMPTSCPCLVRPGRPQSNGGPPWDKQAHSILLQSLTYLGVSVQFFAVGKSCCIESFRVLVRLLQFLPLFLGHHQREIWEFLADQHCQNKPNPVSSSVFWGHHLPRWGKQERSNLLKMEIRNGSDFGFVFLGKPTLLLVIPS